jgi:hypothetical protein
MKTSEEFFIETWGTGFINATLSDGKGLLKMSMKDIYETMQDYAKHVSEQSKVVLPDDEEIDKMYPIKEICYGMGDSFSNQHNSGAREAAKALRDKIASQLSETKEEPKENDGWISVEDRLPDNYVGVLVYIENQDTIANAHREQNGDWVAFYDNTLITNEGKEKGVTHWQPLPEPPKQ